MHISAVKYLWWILYYSNAILKLLIINSILFIADRRCLHRGTVLWLNVHFYRIMCATTNTSLLPTKTIPICNMYYIRYKNSIRENHFMLKERKSLYYSMNVTYRLDQERRDHEMAQRLANETNGHVEGSPPQLRRFVAFYISPTSQSTHFIKKIAPLSKYKKILKNFINLINFVWVVNIQVKIDVKYFCTYFSKTHISLITDNVLCLFP